MFTTLCTCKGYQVKMEQYSNVTLLETNQSNACLQVLQGLTDELYGFIKSRKRSILVIYSYLKDSLFEAVKRNAKF